MKNWSFKQFLNTDNSAWREDYYTGLAEALKKYNVDEVILPTVNRFGSSSTQYIIAESANVILGGIRIEIKTPNNKLPLEISKISNSGSLKEKIRILSQDENSTIAELCGLWTNSAAKEQLGGIKGFGQILCDKAVQAALDLNVDTIIAIPPRHTLQYFLNLNFSIDSELQNIHYPDERYLSTVVWYKSNSNQKNKYQQITQPELINNNSI